MLWNRSLFGSVAEAQKISVRHPKICFVNTWSQEGWGPAALVLMGVWMAQALFLALC